MAQFYDHAHWANNGRRNMLRLIRRQCVAIVRRGAPHHAYLRDSPSFRRFWFCLVKYWKAFPVGANCFIKFFERVPATAAWTISIQWDITASRPLYIICLTGRGAFHIDVVSRKTLCFIYTCGLCVRQLECFHRIICCVAPCAPFTACV